MWGRAENDVFYPTSNRKKRVAQLEFYLLISEAPVLCLSIVVFVRLHLCQHVSGHSTNDQKLQYTPSCEIQLKNFSAFPEVTSIVAKSKTKVLSYLITIGMMKISVEGENLSRVRWLILAVVAAAVVLLNFILRKATFFNSDKVQ